MRAGSLPVQIDCKLQIAMLPFLHQLQHMEPNITLFNYKSQYIVLLLSTLLVQNQTVPLKHHNKNNELNHSYDGASTTSSLSIIIRLKQQRRCSSSAARRMPTLCSSSSNQGPENICREHRGISSHPRDQLLSSTKCWRTGARELAGFLHGSLSFELGA